MDDMKKLREALNIANNKWVVYEQEYILPCFDLAKASGIDLRKELEKNRGTNCVVLLVKLLQAQIERLQQEIIQSKPAPDLSDFEGTFKHFDDETWSDPSI